MVARPPAHFFPRGDVLVTTRGAAAHTKMNTLLISTVGNTGTPRCPVARCQWPGQRHERLLCVLACLPMSLAMVLCPELKTVLPAYRAKPSPETSGVSRHFTTGAVCAFLAEVFSCLISIVSKRSSSSLSGMCLHQSNQGQAVVVPTRAQQGSSFLRLVLDSRLSCRCTILGEAVRYIGEAVRGSRAL